MKAYLVRGLYMGSVVYWTWVEFNEITRRNVYTFTCRYRNNTSFYSKNDAESHVRDIRAQFKNITNLEVVQV